MIYSTDLLHPHDDPDDHFDLATLFAMPELDVKAILLDLGAQQARRPGRVPVEQMFRLTGRRVPYATGLSEKLKSPDDKGLDQPQRDQAAIRLLVASLRTSPKPVIVFTTGSVRDVCAAFNREPALLRKKIARLYLNIGTLTEGEREWNVQLDPHAYVGLMRSGLPIYWCPCLPLNENRSTHWTFKQSEVFDSIPPPLLNWFIYALQQVRPDEIDPTAALGMNLRPWRHILMGQQRNMWCTGPLLHAAGRTVYRIGDQWRAATAPPEGGQAVEVFTFVRTRVEVDEMGCTRRSSTDAEPNMHVYKVTDPTHHAPALKSCLRDLLARFPVRVRVNAE